MPRTVLALAPLASFGAPLWRGDVEARPTPLSEREIRVWSRLRRPERRRQWLAARWLAKWAYLRETARESAPGSAGASEDFEVLVAGAGHLGRFPAAVYREVDVLAAAEPTSGPPRLRHRAQATAFCVSLAHTDEWVACALGRGQHVGVDVEGIEARSPAFEAYAFAEAERRWMHARRSAAAATAPALQTWLWSMKEAALKTGLCGRRTCPTIVVSVAEETRGPTLKPSRVRASLSANDALIDGKSAEWISLELAGSVASVVRFSGDAALCMGRAT